jgi:hypothetical protein
MESIKSDLQDGVVEDTTEMEISEGNDGGGWEGIFFSPFFWIIAFAVGYYFYKVNLLFFVEILEDFLNLLVTNTNLSVPTVHFDHHVVNLLLPSQ